ncbi:MAG: outer membrane protein transport protein [Nitrospira sp.]|nr:outer membrane protein transport protein [Nitrospira sp.]
MFPGRGVAAVIVTLMVWSVSGQLGEAGAQVIRFQPQGARAAGQGNAFAASVDDASAVHYNPAGLSRARGLHSVVGTNLVGGTVTFHGQTGSESRGDFNGTVSWPPPSFFYLSANLGTLGLSRLSAVTLGVGVTSPYGLNIRYPIDGPFRTIVVSSALPLIDIKPTVAYQINDSLSVGVGADIYTFAGVLGAGHAETKLISDFTFGIPPGLTVEFNGRGTGAGVTVGIQYAPLRNADGLPLVSLAVVYRSRAVVPLKGAILANGVKVVDASIDLVLPHIVTGAFAIWPIRASEREWKVEFDVEYVGWSVNRDLDIRLQNGMIVRQPQNWNDVPVIALGTEYRWLNPTWLPSWEVAVRTGYTYTGDPVPSQTFNPSMLSLTAHTFSLGAGVMCKGAGRLFGLIPCSGTSSWWPRGIGLDVAFQEWFYESRTVAGNLLSPTVNGTYRASVHVGLLGLHLFY